MGKRKSLDNKGSPASKKGGRQGTIGQAFALANNKAALAQLEVTEELGQPISNYDSQNIRNTLVHHLNELSHKRRWVPAAAPDTHLAQGRAARKQRASSDDDVEATTSIPGVEAHEEERDPCLGDEDACRYLGQLKELTSSRTIPTREQLQSVVDIVRSHGLHGRKDLSSAAFNLLQHVARLHPRAVVKRRAEGLEGGASPYVLVNANAWTLTGCCDSFNLDQLEEDPLPTRITPFHILNHLLTLAYRAVLPSAKDSQAPSRSTALTSGDLFFLKWVLSELEGDLRCRLQVFYEVQSNQLQSRKVALLQNSQLWRTFSDSASKTSALERKEVVQKLMEIIAAPADPEMLAGPGSVEEAAFNAGELADLAAKLLQMLLDLYGAAEDAKVFQKHGVNRVTTTGVLENVRMVIETAMVDGLVGSGQVLRTLAQKRAFLVQLHPRNRMRLLAVIVAKGHARRKTDSANYPSLERLNFLYTNHGDVDAYLQADPAEVLSYILDDLATALSFNLVDKTADGLAMLVSQLTQAAISQVPDEKMKVMEGILAMLVAAFAKHANTSVARTLTPAASLSLHAAQFALAAAK